MSLIKLKIVFTIYILIVTVYLFAITESYHAFWFLFILLLNFAGREI